MDYVRTIAEALDYIESNLNQDLSLDSLAQRFYLSKFHFSRIFDAVTHRTLKSYVDERRMVAAARELRQGRQRVIDIAIACGFHSQAVFSRRFREAYGLTPFEFRRAAAPLHLPPRIVPVERDFRNLSAGIVTRCSIEEWGDMTIYHRTFHFHMDVQDDFEKTDRAVAQFVEQYLIPLRIGPLYIVADTGSAGANAINFRYGYSSLAGKRRPALKAFFLPASRYIVLRYKGYLGHIYPTAFEDVYRLLNAENLSIKKNGIDFIQLLDEHSPQEGYRLYVPIL